MLKHRAPAPTVSPVPVNSLGLSAHARQRGAQRGISPAQMEWVIRLGRPQYAHGALHIFFGRREAARYRSELGNQVDRLEGLTVVQSLHDETVITAYRDQRAWKAIRKKVG